LFSEVKASALVVSILSASKCIWTCFSEMNGHFLSWYIYHSNVKKKSLNLSASLFYCYYSLCTGAWRRVGEPCGLCFCFMVMSVLEFGTSVSQHCGLVCFWNAHSCPGSYQMILIQWYYHFVKEKQ
jgi:hypothetical protein